MMYEKIYETIAYAFADPIYMLLAIPFFGLLGIVTFIPATLLGYLKGRSWRKNNPTKRSFTWGFIYGYNRMLYTIFASAIVSIISAHIIHFFYHQGFTSKISLKILIIPASIFTLLLTLDLFLSYLVLKRSKKGWLWSTMLSINLLFWIVNIIYISNRWEEFVDDAKKSG